MPYYRLVNTYTDETLAVRRMTKDAARLLNQETPQNQEWQIGLDPSSRNPVKSIAQLTRTLDTEGFTDYNMNQIERYLDQEAKDKARRRREFKKVQDKFGKAMSELPDDTRKVITNFLRMRSSHSFEAGLKIGLTGHLVKQAPDD